MSRKHLSEPRPEWGGEREKFYEEHFGKTRLVLHPFLSQMPHVDVHVIGPDDDRQDHTLLVTNGLSDLWMEAPPALPESKRRVELIMYCQPLEIAPMSTVMPLEVQLIQKVADIPISTGKWLSEFLAAPFSMPPKPIAEGSKLTVPFLLPPMFEDEAVNAGLELSGGERATFLWLDFLTTAEFNFRVANSAAAMLKKFQEKKHSPVLDVSRASYV